MRKRKYSIKKISIALILLGLIIYGISLIKSFIFKGIAIDKVIVTELTKSEIQELKKFNNNYHIEVAQKKGLAVPLPSQKEVQNNLTKHITKNKLKKVDDCRYYEVPKLTNSLPYLKKDAANFLDELGKRFESRLSKMNVRYYRFSVTSILRTQDDQKSLRKSNVNATKNLSSHYFGRTVDLSQNRFFERGNSTPIYSFPLRNLLLRELLEMQKEGKCYVLLEHQTKCIHITVR